MTRAHKRDVDKAALRESWQRQAVGLGLDTHALTADALSREAPASDGAAGRADPAGLNGAAKTSAAEAVE